MGICSSLTSRQDMMLGPMEQSENDMTTYKISGKDEFGQSLVISSKQLNIEDDPTKQYLNLYYEKHKKEIDPKFLKLYIDILNPDPQPATEINLKSHEITKMQAKYLSSLLPYCPKLQKLNLWDTRLGDAGIRYLTKCLPKLPMLEQLSIEENQITSDGFMYFSKGLRYLIQLKVLSLSGNAVGIEGGKALAFALESCGMLQELYMDSTELDNNLLDVISKTIELLEKIEKVGLAYNKLDSSSLKIIKPMLERSRVNYLCLSGINISEDEADNLVAEFINITIRI